MTEKMSKQRLNIFLIIDCSTSMRGERIGQVNSAVKDIQRYLSGLQEENSNVDFYITVITFSTEARLYNKERMKEINEFSFSPITAGGWSNMHLAYLELEKLLHKESKGGIMPDFGGVAPIILLLTDGHPTKDDLSNELSVLQSKAWFNAALKYGIAIELKDERTMNHLRDFVSGNGDVVKCYCSGLLSRIIKIIVFTASKVKSQSVSVKAGKAVSCVSEVKIQVRHALEEVDDWEW